jgi:hypothetical protein
MTGLIFSGVSTGSIIIQYQALVEIAILHEIVCRLQGFIYYLMKLLFFSFLFRRSHKTSFLRRG